VPKLPAKKDALITSKSAILVEGDDEIGFFEALVKDMGLTLGTDIEVWAINGKDSYRDKFLAFQNISGFDNINSFGLIRDADNNAKGALMSIQNILRREKHPCPDSHAVCVHDVKKNLKVGIFIMPGNGAKKGMLEDLCLQSIQDHPIKPDMEEYVSQVKQKMQSKAPKNESKAKLQTFLAGQHEITPHLGIAAQKGHWNFKHEAFAEIRNFIHDLTTFD